MNLYLFLQIKMAIREFFLLCIVTVFINVKCKTILFGEDDAQVSTSFLKCIKDSGQNDLIILYVSDPQNTSYLNVIKAKNAGLNVHLLYPPCRNETPAEISKSFRTLMGNHMIERLWLYPSNGVYGLRYECDWGRYSNQSNCEYLKELVKQLRQYNFDANVISYTLLWPFLFGSIDACAENSQLWWIPFQEQQNGKPDFGNYKKFGGWTLPSMKAYDQRQLCGQDMSESYYSDN